MDSEAMDAERDLESAQARIAELEWDREQLIRESRMARAEVARLREDAARLDWLEKAAKAGVYIEIDPIDPMYGVGLWKKREAYGDDPDVAANTLRETIDEASAAQEPRK